MKFYKQVHEPKAFSYLKIVFYRNSQVIPKEVWSKLDKLIIDAKRIRQLFILCNSTEEAAALNLKKEFKETYDMNTSVYNENGIWKISGSEWLLYSQLRFELNKIIESIKLHCCNMGHLEIMIDDSLDDEQ